MRRLKTIKILTTVLLLLAVSGARAQWQGEFEIEEGVTRVLNPETPAEDETVLEMNELWRVGGDDEDFLFGVISQLLHDDDGNIYLLDGQLSEIQVFAPGGEFSETLSREGEGPGEFRNGIDMFWMPNGELGVVQAWPGKIVLVSPLGDSGGEYKLPFRDGTGFQVASRGIGLDDRIVLSGSAWTTVDGKQMQLAYLKSFDAAGQELAHFHESASETRFGGWEFQEANFADFQRRWAVAPDGRVAAVLPFAEYRIQVWNADGSLDRIIERPGYRPVPRTDQEKKRFLAMYERFTRWNPGSTFLVDDNHQSVGQIFFRDDGSLWVQSGRDMYRPEAGRYTSFDVYDVEGRFAQRVHLQADADAVEDGLFFAGNRAYIVTDLFSALMASLGGDEDDGLELDPEPVSVIAFEFMPPGFDVTRVR